MTHRRATPLWNPASESYIFRLDGSDSSSSSLLAAGDAPITDGATIAKWKCLEGTRTFVGLGSSNKPTWNSNWRNGRGAVRVDSASAQVLVADIVTGFSGLAGITAVVVFQNANGNPLVGWSQESGQFGRYLICPGFAFIRGTASGDSSIETTVTSVNDKTPGYGFAPMVHCVSVNYTTSIIDSYIDTVYTARTVLAQGGANTIATLPHNLFLGAYVSAFAPTNFMDGHIAEVRIIPRAMTPAEVVPMLAHHCVKWDIA